jgi:hypothetical protein
MPVLGDDPRVGGLLTQPAQGPSQHACQFRLKIPHCTGRKFPHPYAGDSRCPWRGPQTKKRDHNPRFCPILFAHLAVKRRGSDVGWPLLALRVAFFLGIGVAGSHWRDLPKPNESYTLPPSRQRSEIRRMVIFATKSPAVQYALR